MLLCLGENSYTAEKTKALTLKMINMDITSTSTYKWCLMATQDLGQFDIEMTNVNVEWRGDSNNSSRAFLRCGQDANNAQIVNLTTTGCTIDVSNTTNTQGLFICAGVSGTFDLNDTDLITSGASIYTNLGSVQFDIDDDCDFNTNSGMPIAMIGDQPYSSFEKALEAANASTKDVTIKILANITLSDTIVINNTVNPSADGKSGKTPADRCL